MLFPVASDDRVGGRCHSSGQAGVAEVLPISLNDLGVKALGRRVAHMRDDPRVPLCVKLEGTVLRTGTTAELALALLRRHPFKLVTLLWWLVLGRAEFRHRVAASAVLDPASLAAN